MPTMVLEDATQAVRTEDQLAQQAVERFEAVQAGDHAAFADMVKSESGWVRAVVYSMLHDPHLTDDVVQQVWLQASRKAAQCKDSQRWRAWLYQVARRAALDVIAENKRKSAASLDSGFGYPASGVDEAPGRMERQEELQRVLSAVRGLPEIYREPLVLRALQGWDYEQIGKTLGLPVPTVETRLVRARRLLRELLSTDA